MSASICLLNAYRQLPFSCPTAQSVVEALRLGRVIFISRCVSSLMNSGNALILAMFVGPTFVGYYSGGERIYRAGIGGLYPSQVIFPKITYLLKHERERARVLLVKSFSAMLLSALLLSTVMFLGAPLLVRVILGPAFTPAVAVLRVFAACPLFRATTDVLGLQWMISHGFESEFTACLATSGIVSSSLALLLSPRWMQIGTAWCVAISEMVLTISVIFCIQLRHISPFRAPKITLPIDRTLVSEPR